MSEKTLHMRLVTIIILTLFFLASFPPIIGGYSEHLEKEQDTFFENDLPLENVRIICSTYGFPAETTNEMYVPIEIAEGLLEKISELQKEIAWNPGSEKALLLQDDIIEIASEYYLLPEETSPEIMKSPLPPNHVPSYHRKRYLPPLENRASAFFCNFITTGTGSQFPVIIFPRLIPIIQLPIPRIFLRWNAIEGITSCGGLLSGKGFIAYGQQKGTALGFWGIGFSVFLPPIMQYGFIGYALYATAEAEVIELWPPNYAPDVYAISPPDGAENIPISTSELSFYLDDFNGDLMNYSVTTNPDIGSGSGSLVSDGEYSIPISGLEGTEQYMWTIQVSDGEDETVETYSFTTEPVAPIVYDPIPEDEKKFVSVNLSMLSFKLKDPQGDLMNYTVETSPDIGSGSGTGVGDGTYTVDVSGLDYLTNYIWYVNVTDGTYWKHKEFIFQTEPIMHFNPFDEGWQYRKEITIDHTKVEDDFSGFPVLVSTVDPDLRDKAQEDGDDILFMDGVDIANRLYHEIEYYDDSNGELVAWVNHSNLRGDEVCILYIYYGNQDCISQEFPEMVWDSHYRMVHHMQVEGSSIYDSTNHNNDGILSSSPYNVNGVIANAIQFDGTDDSIDIPYDSSLEPIDLTYSVWGRVTGDDSAGLRQCYFGIKRGKDYWGNGDGRPFSIFAMMDHGQRNYLALYEIDDNDPQQLFVGDAEGENNTWYYFVTTFDEASEIASFYMDGDWSASDVMVSEVIWYNDDMGFTFGKYYRDPRFYDCTIDEVRISDIIRSDAWIKTNFNNQNDPSGFCSFGPEEQP
jgi:hypothetical protein